MANNDAAGGDASAGNGGDAAAAVATNPGSAAGPNATAKPKFHKRTKIKFEGETAEMNGHVFQTFGESMDKRQFTKTMEALKRYINKQCKHAGDMSELFDFKNPTVTEPTDITVDEARDAIKMLRWTEKTKKYLRREEALKDNLKIVHAVIWGQCSLSLQAKIKQEKDFVSKDKANDCAWLLLQI